MPAQGGVRRRQGYSIISLTNFQLKKPFIILSIVIRVACVCAGAYSYYLSYDFQNKKTTHMFIYIIKLLSHLLILLRVLYSHFVWLNSNLASPLLPFQNFAQK